MCAPMAGSGISPERGGRLGVVESGRGGEGITLRQAALTVAFAMLVMTVAAPLANFYFYPRVVVSGDIAQTVQNLVTHRGYFLGAILGFLVNFTCDLVIAWALYFLLAPVNRALALLMAWFQVVYTAVGFVAVFKLISVDHLVHGPEFLALLGAGPLGAQVRLLLEGFRSEWSAAMVLFEIHLLLLGYLVFRSGYIPRILGILLVIDGVGWMVDSLSPYLYPNAPLGLISITWYGELVFMVWLLARGWGIREPVREL